MPTEAPPAAPAPAAPPAASPPNPSPPTTTINVVPQPVQPSAPPKTGSVMEQMFADLEKKAADNEARTTGQPAPTQPKREAVVQADQEPELPEAPEPGEPPADPNAPKKKANPWKIVDQWKARASEAEARLAEAAAAAVNPAEKAKLDQRLAELEKKNQELEEEMKFEAFSKSRFYKETYEKPYEDAWETAMQRMGKLTVVENGEERPVNTNDLLELVKTDNLNAAYDLAEEKFGRFAERAMEHREKILDLFTAKQKALADARANTEERERQMVEQSQRTWSELQTSVQELAKKHHEAAINDEKAGKFFKPAEGDDENNKRLERGYQLVDMALARNIYDPSLTPQQREELVRAQVAVRHRAAAFGRVAADNVKLTTENQELRKRLEEYEGSTPNAGGSQPPTTPAVAGSVMDQMMAELERRAK